MKKMMVMFAILVLSLAGWSQKSIYDFKVTDIEGKEFDFYVEGKENHDCEHCFQMWINTTI